MSKWREAARDIIGRALREAQALGLEGRDLERFVSARYPWGPRENHPYQIWLDEFARQVRGVRPSGRQPRADLPGQMKLFGADG